jgi:hypothetical protein
MCADSKKSDPAPKKANNTPDKKGGSSGDSSGTPACVSQNSNDLGSCNSAYDSAQSSCDTSNNSTLNGLSGTALGMGQQTGSSVNAACSNMGGVSQGANAALATYRVNCNNAKNSCTSACSSLKSKIEKCATDNGTVDAVKNSDEYKKLASNVSGCNSLQTKVDQATQAMQNYANTSANAANCNAASAATAVDPSQVPSTDPNSAYCQAHPTDANCVASCARTDLPEIASSKTCTCFRNPSDPSCSGVASSSSMNTGIASQGGGVSTATEASANDLNLGAMDGGYQGQEAPKSTGPGEDVGGKQGNGAAIGGGDSLMAAGTGSHGDAGAAVSETPRMGGAFYGSSGSRSGGGYYGGGGGGAYAASSAPAGAAEAKTPDLRQFLPGGKLDPKRGLAGMKMPAGISGPETGNWDKVQKRYRLLESTLLP